MNQFLLAVLTQIHTYLKNVYEDKMLILDGAYNTLRVVKPRSETHFEVVMAVNKNQTDALIKSNVLQLKTVQHSLSENQLLQLQLQPGFKNAEQ